MFLPVLDGTRGSHGLGGHDLRCGQEGDLEGLILNQATVFSVPSIGRQDA